jgi:phage protein D
MVVDIVELSINGELVSMVDISTISFDDQAGVKSDKVTINVKPNFKRPAPNSKLELTFKSFINDELKEELKCGLFHTQTVTRSNNKSLFFTATGVEFSEKQKEKISLHYENTKLSNIVSLVAKRLNHKLTFKTDDLLIKSLNQTNETDINFLDRLAKDYNVTFSIKNDCIYFVNKDNDDLPLTTVNIEKCHSSSFKHSTKTYYKSCTASWHDTNKAKTITVSVFDGTPVLKIKGSYQDKNEATIKAKAKLLQANKGIIKGSFSNRGISIYAGTKVKSENTYYNEDDGIYSVESCKHTWRRSGGWTTDVQIEN